MTSQMSSEKEEIVSSLEKEYYLLKMKALVDLLNVGELMKGKMEDFPDCLDQLLSSGLLDRSYLLAEKISKFEVDSSNSSFIIFFELYRDYYGIWKEIIQTALFEF